MTTTVSDANFLSVFDSVLKDKVQLVTLFENEVHEDMRRICVTRYANHKLSTFSPQNSISCICAPSHVYSKSSPKNAPPNFAELQRQDYSKSRGATKYDWRPTLEVQAVRFSGPQLSNSMSLMLSSLSKKFFALTCGLRTWIFKVTLQLQPTYF